MHYLKCMALLEHLLKQLYAGQRKQVDVKVIPQIEQVMQGIQTLLKDDNIPSVNTRLDDIMRAIMDIKSTPNLLYFTDGMKQVIVDGFMSIEADVAIKAFDYFKYNDFDDTEQIRSVMRRVVEIALDKGVLKV